MNDPIVDCIIVGGGPAGLTAALYLARFRRSTVVIDDGQSRASLIPVVRNLAGFESGINGNALLAKMRRQIECYDVPLVEGRVTTITRTDGGFLVEYGSTSGPSSRSLVARHVLLACGIRDKLPPIDDAIALTQEGLLRFCAICDGFEAQGKRIAMLGPASRALSHALFFRTFCQQVAVIASDNDALTQQERALAAENAIELITTETLELSNSSEASFSVACQNGRRHAFDAIYPVLGCLPQANLLSGLDVQRDNDGMIVTDKHQRTSVDGLYAAGDAVNSLNQICVAIGEAAVASLAIHRSLPANPL
ncbi:NAD(P)/FAD-dependent oxidoreductase [Caballeronia sp. AZ10_KS36]|uniref:NAD(P)/FAD-dependent oxidoreductase n=1 Tax=Caballeronia sp. AZ10_KS36 TaxID=2921757 RepID=UPI0020291046|nr:NAD(P)/FAD-dependent oxidoreductase [Caballeronia sp. AZ10_KS36]